MTATDTEVEGRQREIRTRTQKTLRLSGETETRLATNIKIRRIGLKLNQQDFGAKIGLRFSVLKEIEEAQGNPTLSLLKRIATGLNCEVWDLFAEVKPKTD